MKTLLKSALIASAIFATTAASAATISVSVSDLVFAGSGLDFDATLVKAQQAEAALLGTISGPKITEGFESPSLLVNSQTYTLGTADQNQNRSWAGSGALVAGKSTINTSVGTFVLQTAGQGSSDPTNQYNAANNLLMIEDSKTGEFGRQSLANKRGHWLDSNDAQLVTWTLGAPLSGSWNAFGFYLSDASDIEGTLKLKFADGTTLDSDLKTLAYDPLKNTNGNIRYVTVISSSTIVNGVVSFIESSKGDGWGIDDITVGHVPEPGSILLMGLGLLGLGAARRRTKA